MPFSEVFNALLITYIATEYSLASSSSSKQHGFSLKTFLSARHNQVVLLVVFSVNLGDWLLAGSAATIYVKEFFERLLHAPKILLAAVLYVLVLYADCLRHVSDGSNLTFRRFLGRVGIQFLKILPLYPFLAVLISCGFMFLISAFEHLNLPLEWLNWPIYYGTLYGPFSLVYFQVKSKIIEEDQYFIPTTTTTIPSDFFASPKKNEVRDLRLMHFGDATKKG